MTEYFGYAKGDICSRNGCDGIIQEHDREGSCSCHISPPCGYCISAMGYCDKCEWDAEEELQEEIAKPLSEYKPTIEDKQKRQERLEKYYSEDDGYLYDVNRYFDYHFEKTIDTKKTLGEARKLTDKYNDSERCYVSFGYTRINI